MTQPSPRRPIFIIAGAFVALVILEFAFSGQVQAACGTGSHSRAERGGMSVVEHLEILSMDPSLRQEIPHAPTRRPCSGPSCSEGGSSGPDAPIPPTKQTGERWISLITFTHLTEPDGSRLLPREASLCPVNCAIALERPPRSLPA